MDSEPDLEDLTGEVIASRYRIEARLGHGAMGTVYRARHLKVGRAFAIKVLHPRFLSDAKTRKRFAREAELAGLLHHPNVVSVVDVGETPHGLSYLVMEYAEGSTLCALVCEAAPLPAGRVISIVRQLCDGLHHAHEHGLIHRDLKTDNVIVERDRDGIDTVKIVDFGIAILREDASSSDPARLTTVGLVLGTPHYMAPEHATGGAIDHRIDLFALGVMCFEMLTGLPPFDGDGVDVARANLLLDTPVMNVRVPGLRVDPLLEAFTRKLMMKSRDARPATAKAARELIDLIERDRPAAAAVLGVVLDEPAAPRSFVGPPPPGRVWPATATTALIPPQPRGTTSQPSADTPPPQPVVSPNGDDTEPILPVRSRRVALAVAAAAGLIVLVVLAIALSSRAPARSERATAPAPSPSIEQPLQRPVQPPPQPQPAPPIGPAPEVRTVESPPPPVANVPRTARPQVARPANRSTVASTIAEPARPAAPAPPAPSADPPPPSDHQLARPTGQPVLPTTHAQPTTSAGVANLYASVGRQLKQLDQRRGSGATADLWPLYLRLRINDVITDPVKCEEADTLLRYLDEQIVERSR